MGKKWHSIDIDSFGINCFGIPIVRDNSLKFADWIYSPILGFRPSISRINGYG